MQSSNLLVHVYGEHLDMSKHMVGGPIIIDRPAFGLTRLARHAGHDMPGYEVLVASLAQN